jgi:hypothetical protein
LEPQALETREGLGEVAVQPQKRQKPYNRYNRDTTAWQAHTTLTFNLGKLKVFNFSKLKVTVVCACQAVVSRLYGLYGFLTFLGLNCNFA